MSTRLDLEKDLYNFLDEMDPSGRNTERMKKLFISMDDKAFYQYMDRFFEDPDMNIQVAYLPYDNPVTIDFIDKIAKKEGIPLWEIVYKPYVDGNVDDPAASPHPVLVMDLPMKRLKQMVRTKTHASITNTKRDAKSGQTTGHDRVGRVTDVEAYSMIVQELYACAQESYGPLADDEAAFFEMQRRIQRDGEVSLNDLPNDPINKVAMNTVNMYMYGSCLCTNLISDDSLILPITLKGRDEQSTTIHR